MTLIVEDGTGVANANSYASLVTIRAYATARGHTVPADDTALEVLAIRAMDYLGSYDDRYRGYRTVETQSLSWPRDCADIGSQGLPIANNAIPSGIVYAQCELVCVGVSVPDFFPVVSGAMVLKETVGPISTEYSERVGAPSAPRLPSVMNYLRPLLRVSGGARTFRV